MASNHHFMGDIVALTKPKITLMAVLVACAGSLHAGSFMLWQTLMSLVGIGALVSGSSALNMYLERDRDGKMARTSDRPLPAKRLQAFWAMAVGCVCTLAACFLLYAASNILTVILGMLSLLLYVFCYTPLKQKSWLALIVGSVPGAMPVALGYVSLANNVDAKVLALFFWAFLWQIPHFLAITLFRGKEYTEAGFPVLAEVFGENVAKLTLLATSWLLVLSTVGLYLTKVISTLQLALCLILGLWFLITCHRGSFRDHTDAWAKRAFKASLLYQGLLFVILIVAALVNH